MIRAALACAAALAAVAGCVPPLEVKWQAIERFEHPTRFAKAPAVVLFREEQRIIHINPRTDSYHQLLRHDVIEVRSEAGQRFADIHVPFKKGGKLLQLIARTLTPEGEIKLVDAAAIRKLELTLAGEDKKDERQLDVRVFRLPDVRPGSRIEYAFVVEVPEPLIYVGGSIVGPLPIEQYRLDVATTWTVDAALKSYNAPWVDKMVEGPLTHFRLALKNIPADSDEPWAGPWLMAEPWWSFRVNGVTVGNSWVPVLNNWANTLAGIARRLYLAHDPRLAAVDGLGPSRGDPREVVRAAVEEVHRRVARSEHGSVDAMRPLAEVVASGHGSDYEKAALVRAQLLRAGVTAWFALATRHVAGAVDHNFYSPMPFDHMLVYVPPQPALDSAIWIDAACEHCRAGQLPRSLLAAEALEFEAVEGRAEVIYSTTWRRVAGEPAVASANRRVYRARLEPSGDLAVEMAGESTGEESLSRRLELRRMTPAQEQDDLVRFVTDAFATGRLDRVNANGCDPAAGRCVRDLRFRLPGYATSDGQRLLVPLVILRSSWDHLLEGERSYGFAIDDPVRIDERLELALPPGWILDEIPGVTTTSSAVVDSASEITLGERDGAPLVTVTRSAMQHPGRHPVSAAANAARALRAFEAVRDRVLVFRRAGAPPPAVAR